MKEPFFIVGCVRSGTTLLRDILRNHPNLECPEETFFFRWGDPFASVRYDQLIEIPILKIHREIDGISEQEFRVLYDAAATRRALADYYGEIYLNKRNNSAARWFDKSPQNVYGMLLISALYPGVKFVHIHRNPLNVVASLMEGKGMLRHTLKGGVNYWNEAVQIINQFKQAWPRQVFELSYESLTKDPAQKIYDLLSFVDEDPSGIEFDREMVHSARNTYLDHLRQTDVEYVREHCRRFMIQYGYI
ncbi:MAG: sulfotransferase family protein [Methylococcales bacterium]